MITCIDDNQLMKDAAKKKEFKVWKQWNEMCGKNTSSFDCLNCYFFIFFHFII